MIQDLLNPVYDNEYDIEYDKIYDDKTKIIGKNNMRDTSRVTNEMTENENTENEMTENEITENGIGDCICGFYQHSRKFFILLFCVIAFLGGILFLISRV
jgi:hypothetical protein